MDGMRAGGIYYPFTPQLSARKRFVKEVESIIHVQKAKRVVFFLGLNVIVTFILLVWSHSTNSMALVAYAYITIFDVFSLLTCLLSIWVEKQEPTPAYSFGYERFEVLAVFASTMLAQLGAFFIVKECIERIFQQPEVHTGRLLLGTTLAFVYNMTVINFTDNKAFNHVISASSSSWLQEHVADMSQSLCHVVPGLSRLLLPRISPIPLVTFTGSLALVTVYIAIDLKSYHSADTIAAMCIASMILGTMFPLACYCGKILLQTTPSHVIGQLDKLMLEASTLDGVLEFRQEHFWTVSFGKLAGTVHVRIQRDANEQLVLAHLTHKLSQLVPILTIQLFKDDWTRGSTYQLTSDGGLTHGATNASLYNSPSHKLTTNSTLTSPNIRPDLNTTGSNNVLGEIGQVGQRFKPNFEIAPNIGLGQSAPYTAYYQKSPNSGADT